MLIWFFGSHGVVHKEFVLQGQTVNQQYYREVLERLRKRVHRVRPEIADTWMLHHDNAPCHCHLREQMFDQKGYSSGSAAPILAWSGVRVTSFFSRNSNSTSNVVILELCTTSKRSWQTFWGYFHMWISSTAKGSGRNVSGGVWLSKGTTLKGIMFICSSVLNKKKFMAPFSLLFRYTS